VSNFNYTELSSPPYYLRISENNMALVDALHSFDDNRQVQAKKKWGVFKIPVSKSGAEVEVSSPRLHEVSFADLVESVKSKEAQWKGGHGKVERNLHIQILIASDISVRQDKTTIKCAKPLMLIKP